MPTWRLRLRSPVQVSTRSPRPLSPASVSRRPPSAHASREISARPRVISAAMRVVPEAEPFDDAGGNRDDVLQRAADLDARRHRRCRRAGAPGPRNCSCTRAAAAASVEATTHGRRQAARDFEREARARQHDDRMAAAGLLRDHLRHPRSESVSSPFVALTITASRAKTRRRGAHHGAHAVRRDGRDDESARRRARRCERCRRRHAVGQRDVRQVARRSRACARSRPPAPRRAPTGARRVRRGPVHRERRAPAARAEDGDAVASSRALPIAALGARAARRRMFARCRKRISAALPNAADTTGGGAPGSHASGGSASGRGHRAERDVAASARPWRRTPPSAATVASGASTAKTPAATATPLPPWNRSQTG